jgi:hypothetical protein
MDRIVIEVDDRLAKAWRGVSDKKRKKIGNKVNLSLAKELMKPPKGKKDATIQDYLNF